MSEGLGRRYRRLLRVYPPGARRDELLDTLLQAAAPGRRGPTVRESANLLRHGIRARLGRPGSTAVVVFAVLVAVVGGFLGAAAAARLSWEAARPLPSGTEAGQLRATVFPGLTVWGGGDAALFVERNDREGIRYGYADYWVKHTSATRAVRPFTEAARDRLRAAGWRIRGDVTPIVEPGTAPTADSERLTGAFWATRDGLALDFSDVYRPGGAADGSDGAALFHLSRTKPAWVDPAAVLGALLGALIGWLLTGWVSRRTERRARASLLVGAATGVAVVLVTPALLLMSLGLVLGGGSPSAQPPTAPFWAPLLDLGQGPVKTAGILAVVVVGVAAWRRPSLPRRAATPPQPWRTQVVPIGALVALLVLLWAGGWGRAGGLVRAANAAWATPSQCTPTVPPAGPDPGDTRLSRTARVFVSTRATPDQVNLVQSAISRFTASVGTTADRDYRSRDFQTTYCGDAGLPPAIGRTLPWYITVWLTSPGAFPALVAEVGQLRGVVAVWHAPRDDW